MTIFLSSDMYLAFTFLSATQDTVFPLSLFLEWDLLGPGLETGCSTALLGGDTLNLERLVAEPAPWPGAAARSAEEMYAIPASTFW